MKNLLAVLGIAAATASGVNAQAVIDLGTYSENFDSMPSSGNATYPANWSGWKVGGTGPLGNSTIITSSTSPAFTTDNGSNTSGTVYNYGQTSGTNRSLGSVASGTTLPAFGVSLTNNTSLTLTASEVTMGFTARQWRTGNSNTANETWVFSYKIDGGLTDLTGWTTLTLFDINEILTETTSSAAVNGLASGNFTVVSPTAFTGLSWAPSTTLHLRWVDANDGGSDAGMAIDDFSVTAVPEPSTWAMIGLGLGFMLWRLGRRQRTER